MANSSVDRDVNYMREVWGTTSLVSQGHGTTPQNRVSYKGGGDFTSQTS